MKSVFRFKIIKVCFINLISLLKTYFLWFKYLISPQSLLPEKLNSNITISKQEAFLLCEPWYHNFDILDFTTRQKKGVFKSNQETKQDIIFDYIDQAISICNENNVSPCGIELFCADGFFSNYAIKHGAKKMHGIDIDKHYLSQAQLITKLLGNENKVSFSHSDVFNLTDKYDFAICAGGLYHISNPYDLLKLLRKKTRFALIIQTVYSLAKISENYFETPAPKLNWGCRFSYSYLLKMVENAGWKVLDSSTNELNANSRPEDRGSAYLLCVPKDK